MIPSNIGGLWESGVKSVKHYLQGVIGNNHLVYEEFYTVLVKIKKVYFRPLTQLTLQRTGSLVWNFCRNYSKNSGNDGI